MDGYKKEKNYVYHALLGSFSMSFWIWFSKNKIYGIMGTNDTFNSIMFKYFLHQMLQYLLNKWVLVADNASIHKTDEIKRFLLSSNLLLTTIPTYSPWLNPWEHLILAIKAKIRQIQRNDKMITLNSIKGIIDELDQSDLKKYIVASLKETLNYVTG